MGLVVKVGLKEGEKVKRFLIKKGLLNGDYEIEREGKFIFLPARASISSIKTTST
ncbi:tRNA (guanine-N1)-methyltransferase, partial [Nanoarchaeota archaeon]